MPALIGWDSGGDGVNWDDARNWTGDQLPGASDDVVIGSLGNAITMNGMMATVRSLISDAGLVMSASDLTVTAGASELRGSLDLRSNSSLTATGSGTTLLASGANPSIQGDLTVRFGAVMSLPTATAYGGGADTTALVAEGTGSRLDLGNVTEIRAASNPNRAVFVTARAGGTVNLDGVTTQGGLVHLRSQDAGSVIELDALSRFQGLASGVVSTITTVNGAIHTASLTHLDRATILLEGGSLDTRQITHVTNGGLRADGASPDLSGVVSIDGSSLTTFAGGTLSLPGVTTYTTGTPSKAFTANGTDSRIELANLTRIDGGRDGATFRVEANSGGTIDLAAVDRHGPGVIHVLALGANSVVDLSGLPSLSSDQSSSAVLTVRAGGSIQIPTLRSLNRVNVEIDGGSLNLDELTDAVNSRFTILGGSHSLAALVNLDESSLFVSGGARLALPALTSYDTGPQTRIFEADGAGTVLDLGNLTHLSGGLSGAALLARATGGGTLDLGGLTDYLGGAINVVADGAGSKVDLERLALLSGATLTTQNQGVIQFGEDTTALVHTIVSNQGTLAGEVLELYAGATLRGSGQVLGDVVNLGGVVNPGDTAGRVLRIQGDFTQQTGGRLQFDVAGASAGQFDQLDVSGDALVLGTLTVQRTGTAPPLGTSLALIEANSVLAGPTLQVVESSSPVAFKLGGTFDTLALEAVDPTVLRVVAVNRPTYTNTPYSSLTLTFSAAPEATGVRDAANYGLQASFGEGVFFDIPVTVTYGGGNQVHLAFASLEEGRYILFVRSGESALRGSDGRALDGDGDFEAGGDYFLFLHIDQFEPLPAHLAGQGNRIQVGFFDDGEMDVASVTQASNYSLALMNNGVPQDLPGAIVAVAYNGDTATLVLREDLQVAEYRLTLNGSIRDRAGNALRADSRVRTFQATRPDVLGTIFWDGGGDGVNWTDARNWSADRLPGTEDEVVIGSRATTVTLASANITVKSLTTERALTLTSSSLTVTAGESTLLGSLTLQGSTLTATGNGTHLTAQGQTTANNSSLNALQGAVLALPGLASYSTGSSGTVFVASGTGSRIDLSVLTALTGSVGGGALNIQALLGGSIDLSSLSDYRGGATAFLASGSNSLIDLSTLTQLSSDAQLTSALSARQGGTIRTPRLTRLDRVDVELRGGTLDTAQLSQALRSEIAVYGGVLDLSGLTDLTNSSLLANAGAVLSLPSLTSYTTGSTGTRIIASGTGSRINLGAVTAITGSVGGGALNIQALLGGSIDLSSLADYRGGSTRFHAGGTGSLIDLSELTQLYSNAALASGLEVNPGGTIRTPRLAHLDRVEMALNGGTLDIVQLVSAKMSSISAVGGDHDFASLTDLDFSAIRARQGAVVAFPSLLDFFGVGGVSLIEAEETGSVIDMGALRAFTGSLNQLPLRVTARSGGKVDLSGLNDYQGGATWFTAQGDASVIDLSSLPRLFGNSRLEASSNGLLDLGQGVMTLANVLVHAQGGTLRGGTLELHGGATLGGSGGTVQADVVNVGGSVNPGDNNPGTLTIDGDYTQHGGGRLDVLASGITGFPFDRLIVTGHADLDGTLGVVRGGGSPTVGAGFEIVSAASRSGTFRTLDIPLSNGVPQLRPEYSATGVTLVVTDLSRLTVASVSRPQFGNQRFDDIRLVFSAALASDAGDADNYSLVDLATGATVPLSVSFDGTAAVTLSFPLLGEGRYRLTVRSGDPGLHSTTGEVLDGDANGNAGGDYVLDLTIDETGPTASGAALLGDRIVVRFDDPSGMFFGPGAPITLASSYALAGAGVDGVLGNADDVNLNGSLLAAAYDPASGMATLLLADPLPDGLYRLVLDPGTFRDRAGNLLQGNRTFDLTTVGLILQGSQGGVIADSTPTFTVSAARAGQLSLDFDGDGQADWSQTVAGPSLVDVTAPTLPDGLHTATATLTWQDAGQPHSRTTTLNFQVDATPPRVVQEPTELTAPVSSVTVRFSESVQTPAASQVQLSGPDGELTVSAVNRNADGSFTVAFPSLTVGGAYALTFAGSIRDQAGNPLDPTALVFRFDVLDVTGPQVVSLTRLAGQEWTFRVLFDEVVQADSFTTADVRVTRPDASVVATALLDLEAVDARTFLLTLPASDLEGVYQVRIGPDVLDAAGNRMRTPGGQDAPYQGTFSVDLTSPTLIRATPQGAIDFRPDNFELTFSEAVDLASLRSAVAITGPAGNVAGIDINQVFDTSYRILFTPQPGDGEYTLTLAGTVTDLAGNALGQSVTHKVQVKLPVDEAALTTGQAATGAIETPGGRDLWLVDLTAGQRVYFELQSADSGPRFAFRLIDPDGAAVFTSAGDRNAIEVANVGPVTIEASGSYRLEVSAEGQGTGGYRFQLWDVPPTQVQAVALRAVAAGAVEVPGAAAEWVFTLDTPQEVFLDFQRVRPTRDAGAVLRLTLTGPGGETLRSGSVQPNNPDALDGLLQLTQAGTYRLRVEGVGNDTAAYRFQLWDVPPPDVSPLTVDEPVTGAIETPGHSDHWTLQVTEPTWVFLNLGQVIDGQVSYRLTDPGGVELFRREGNVDGGPVLLNQPGTYTLAFGGRGDDTPTYDFTLARANPRVQATTLDATVEATIESPGRADAWSFQASAGQRLYFDLQGVTGAADGPMRFRLCGPGGAEVLATETGVRGTDDADGGPVTFTATGTWTLVVVPPGDDLPTYRFRLWEVPPTAVAALELGQEYGGTLATPGASVEYTFTVEADTFVALEVPQLTGGAAVFELLDSQGQMLKRTTGTPVAPFRAGTGQVALTAGAYRLVVRGLGDDQPGYRLRLSEVPEANVRSLNGDALGRSTGVPDHWQFTAGAGDTLGLDVLAIRSDTGETLRVTFRLLDPEGRALFATEATSKDASAGDHPPVSLSLDGTYTLEVLTPAGLPGEYEFRLVSRPPVSVRTATLGQTTSGTLASLGAAHAWQFSVEAGQDVFFDIRSLSANRGDHRFVDFRLVGPGGDTLFTRRGDARHFNDADLGPVRLSQGGTYTLMASAVGNFTGAYGFTLWAVPGPDRETLGLDEVVQGAIETPGRSDEWTFTAGAGERLFLDLQKLLPAEQVLEFQLFSQAGMIWAGPGDTLLPPLPEPGEYTLRVSGKGDDAASYALRLWRVANDPEQPGAIGGLIQGSIDVPGSTDVWAVDVRRGGDFFLYVTEVVPPQDATTTQTLRFVLKAPNEAVLLGGTASAGGALLGPVRLGLPGTYRVEVSGVGDSRAGYAFRLAAASRGITDVLVPEDAGNSTIDLASAFSFSGDAVPQYQVVGNTNPTLFDAVTISGATLTLDYRANAFGTATLTVRATAGDEFAQASFRVQVTPVNDPPKTTGLDDVTEVVTPPPDRVVRLFGRFSDVENGAQDLVYTLTDVSNSSLFSSIILNNGNGTLRLRYAPEVFGVSDLTMRATDAGGAFVEDTFRVTVNPGGQADGFEANDTFADATDLGTLAANGQRGLFANIHVPGDEDFYRFRLDQDGVTVRLETNVARQGGALDSVLTLFGSNELARSFNDDIVGRDSRLTATLDAGDYFVRVSGFDGSVGNYQLTITTVINGPRVLRLSPGETLAESPTTLGLDLDSTDLDPATVTTENFKLERVDADGAVLADLSNRIGTVGYDAGSDRITLTLTGLLVDGGYRLTMKDSVKGANGQALDGDNSGTPGGDFVGTFGIDTTAPEGTLGLAGVAPGGLYVFSGVVRDDFPAVNGESIRVELDVDGDGFDDGVGLVPRSRFGTPFTVTSTTPLAGGQGLVNVRARFTDARGNVSAPVLAAVDTGLPIVTAVRAVGDTIRVTYNLAGLAGMADASSYRVTGEGVGAVVYDDATRTATLVMEDGSLAEGTYTVTVYSGQTAVHRDTIDLDGDGDGVAGGNHVTTVTVDHSNPVLVDVRLSPFDDNARGVHDDNRGFAAQPTLLVTVSDVFPTTSTGRITVRIDADGDGLFDDGLAVVTPTTSGQAVAVPVQVTAPPATASLAGASVNYALQIEDAAGNRVPGAVTVFLDRTGPAVVNTLSQVLLVQGQPIGLRFTLTFDEALDPVAAENFANYRLVRAGGDRDFSDFDGADVSGSIFAIEHDGNTVVVTVNLTSQPDDDYRLTVKGTGVTDVAGNGLRAGDYSTSVQFRRTGPQLTAADVFVASGFTNEAADRVFLQFEDVDLDRTSATDVNNYRLVDLATNTELTITSAQYDSFGDRVIVSGFGGLAAGNYQLTVSGNIRSTSGVPLVGGDFTTTLSVLPPAQVTALDPAVFQGNANALASQAGTLLPQIATSQKALTAQAFAQRLLDEARLVLEQATGTGDQVTAAVNARLRTLYEQERAAEYGLQSYLPPEVLILWTSQSRFVLSHPYDDATLSDADRLRVGFDAAGGRILQLPGTTLVGGTDLSVLIVPVDLMRELLARTPPAFRVDGTSVTPDLRFTLELEGLGEQALASALYFGPTDASGVQVVAAAPNAVTRQTLDLGDVLRGFDTNIPVFDAGVLDRVEAVVGDLTQVNNLLVIWFDPVDFVLTDAQGRQVGFLRKSAQSFNNIPGAFYSGDGFTELVVIPNALNDIYSLALSGIGADFRGQATLIQGGFARSTPLQGVLGGHRDLNALLDFSQATPTSLRGQQGPGGPGSGAVLVGFENLAVSPFPALATSTFDATAADRATAIAMTSSDGDSKENDRRRALAARLRQINDLEGGRGGGAGTAATGGGTSQGMLGENVGPRRSAAAQAGVAAVMPALADLFALDRVRSQGLEALRVPMRTVGRSLGLDNSLVLTMVADASDGTVRLLEAGADPARQLASDLGGAWKELLAALEDEGRPTVAAIEEYFVPLAGAALAAGEDQVWQEQGTPTGMTEGTLAAFALGVGVAAGGLRAWSRDDEAEG